MSKRTVPCHCIGPLTFGEPIPDCESCHGSGLAHVLDLLPDPTPDGCTGRFSDAHECPVHRPSGPRETQIQTEVRLERERCVTIVRDRAGSCRSVVERLAQLGYGVGAKAYRELAIEFDELADFMARGPLDR